MLRSQMQHNLWMWRPSLHFVVRSAVCVQRFRGSRTMRCATDTDLSKEGKTEMHLKTSMQKLIRLSFEQPALLSGVFMTPLLEAYAGSPLQVRLLSQQLRPLEAAIPELMLDQW